MKLVRITTASFLLWVVWEAYTREDLPPIQKNEYRGPSVEEIVFTLDGTSEAIE